MKSLLGGSKEAAPETAPEAPSPSPAPARRPSRKLALALALADVLLVLLAGALVFGRSTPPTVWEMGLAILAIAIAAWLGLLALWTSGRP